jgi:hypothetical protein
MLRATLQLSSIGDGPSHVRNAFIESFCIHARNLIEFFKDKKDCDFDRRRFAKEGYRIDKRFVGDGVLGRINGQISHLSKKRTREVSKKIDGEERRKILDCIEGELERLEKALHPSFRSSWSVPSRPPNISARMETVRRA